MHKDAHWTDRGAWLHTLDHEDPQRAWDECERGDWMLWLLAQQDPADPALVLATCDRAERALPAWTRMYPEDDRPRRAIETARQVARGVGGVSPEDAWTAADDADDAAYAAADAAYAAAYAAADAAYAAADADAAYAVADAAYAAADAATLRQCADIVRQHHPTIPRSRRRTRTSSRGRPWSVAGP